MPLNFPTTGLTAGVTTYTFGGNTWIWNGYAWDSVVTPNSVGLTAYVRTWNGQTGDIVFSNYVTSVNGLTGAVTGIAGTGSNTFTGLQTMNAGITSNNLYVSAGATFNSDVTISGNLTVSGGITSTFSENVLIEDNFILLNSNVTGGSPSENAGIEISRGASANVQLRWNETTDNWQFTNDGTQFYNLPTSVVNTINGYTGAFTLTGTANEVEITGATSFVVGLPDNVTITNLTVTNSVTASHFDGPLIGRVTAIVKNDDTITLTAGMPVYISGYQGSGNSGILLVKAADASNSSTMPALGLVETTLAVNDQGHVVELGLLGSLNTNGFGANQVVYIAPGGGLTATRPTAGTHLVQNIGRVVNASTTQGQIIVLGPGRSNDVPNRITVRDYLEMPNGQTATSLVTSWNGASGAVTYATPLATSSVTGVASFGNEFVVSAAGAVSLTGNYVKSWNGSTGAVTFSNYVTSVNGSTGAVTNVAKTDTAQTFTSLQTFNAGITANNLYVSQGVTFASTSVHTDLATFNGGITGTNISAGGATFTGIAVTTNGISVTGGIAGTLVTAAQTNITSVGTLSSITTSGLGTFNAGLTANNLFVSSGATFNSDVTFNSGLSANSLWVTNGATFAARSAFTAGLTSNNLWVTNGATFAASSAFTAGLTTSNLWVTAGSTFAGRAAFTAGITGSGTISGFTGIHGPTNGSMLRIWSGPWNTLDGGIAKIEIDGSAGGDISLYPVSGQVTIKRNPSLVQLGQGSQLRIQSGDGSSFDYWSTISTGTVNANRTYTLPDLTGTLAVVDAAQSFTALQSFNSGLTTSHLWVTNGATFAARSSFNSGLTANTLMVASGATFFGNADFRSGLSADDIWVTNGATFSARSSFNSGLSASNLWATNGVTFAGTVSSDTGYRVSSTAFNAQSGTAYTLATADNGEIITMNNGAVSNITVPAGLPIGFNTMIIQLGTGQVGFTAASGVTLNSYASGLKISGQHGAATVISYATNVYNISGTLSV